MVNEVGLAAIVVEAQSDLRIVGRHRIRSRTRHEPHHPDEPADVDDHQDDQLDEEGRTVRDERAKAFDDVADVVEVQHDHGDPKEDQQTPFVVLEHVRGRREDPSSGQFTPTT